MLEGKEAKYQGSRLCPTDLAFKEISIKIRRVGMNDKVGVEIDRDELLPDGGN